MTLSKLVPSDNAASPGFPVSPAVAMDAFARLPATVASMAVLGDGWIVERFIHRLPPLVIAELRQYDRNGVPDSPFAYWFLDQDGHFLGNALSWISPNLAAKTRNELMSLLATHDTDDGLAFDGLVGELRGLSRQFRLALMKHLFEGAPAGPLEALGIGPDEDARLAIVDETYGVSLVIDGALEFPLVNGNGIVSFEPGWRATDLITCLAPLLVIELRHADGRAATWVVDEWLGRIDGEDFAHPRTIEILRRVAPPMIRRHWRQLLDLDDTRPDYRPLPMLRLNQGALLRFFHRVRDQVMPETLDQVLTTFRQPIVLPPVGGRPAALFLPEDHVRRAVQHRLYEAGIQAVQRGRMTWPSPVDGSDAALEAVFVPQEYTIIYQFLDRNGLRFMVATGERDCQLIGLYLPLDHRFLGDVEPPNWWFRGHIPADFWAMLYEHCLGYAETIRGRHRPGAIEVVNVFMTLPFLHIGHYVWNDLTGQAALLRDLGDETPRSLIIASSRGQAEFFGPLDTLFPQLAGRVDRSLPGKHAFTALTYSAQIVPIRLTGAYIDRALRETVRAYMTSTPTYASAEREREKFGSGPVIIAGLRLEDRTFVDSVAFYQGLIDHLDRSHPGATIVLDGRNSKPGGQAGEFIASIKDHLSVRPPLAAELELVDRIRTHAAGREVSVVSTVGLPIESSMAWCYLASLCVAPWGAGLAKYRWLANLPSVILTSRHNIQRRPDLDIYHSPNWMEDPSRLVFPDPEKVIDRIDVAGIAPSNSDAGGRECFEVDLPHIWTLVDKMLAER